MTSRRPHLYVDVDDVLCETTRALARLAGERFAKQVAFDSMQSFDLRVSIGLDDEEYRRFMHAAHDPGFLLGLPVVEGAVAVLGGWRERGFEISVITGRPPATRGVTEEWLRGHGIAFDSLEMVDKYDRHPGESVVRRRALAERAYDFAVEDSVELACFLVEGATRSALLMDRPWNRDQRSLPEAVERVTSWSEIDVRITGALESDEAATR